MKTFRKLFCLLIAVVLTVSLFVCSAASAAAAGPMGGIPFTGDESNLTLWITIGAVAMVGVVCAAVIVLKKK